MKKYLILVLIVLLIGAFATMALAGEVEVTNQADADALVTPINEDVRVTGTATLDGLTIDGNVYVEAGNVRIKNCTINGNIVIEKKTTGWTRIHDNTIDGNIEFKEADNIRVYGNTVDGNIKFEKCTGAPAGCPGCPAGNLDDEVFGNTINGNIEIV